MIWTRNYVSETQGYESQNIFLLHNPWTEDQFSYMRDAFASPCTIFTPGKPQILSREQAAVLNSTCLFLAVFTFIPITYVTRYKKNR